MTRIFRIVVCWLLGQAWIVFDETMAATNALRQLQGFPFYGKAMRIDYAKTMSDAVARRQKTYVPRHKRKALPELTNDTSTAGNNGKRIAGSTIESPQKALTSNNAPPSQTILCEDLPAAATEEAVRTESACDVYGRVCSCWWLLLTKCGFLVLVVVCAVPAVQGFCPGPSHWGKEFGTLFAVCPAAAAARTQRLLRRHNSGILRLLFLFAPGICWLRECGLCHSRFGTSPRLQIVGHPLFTSQLCKIMNLLL